ncbi:MAG: sortase [Chloroflexi bacterium]|nr:sortase [Chloroflexota bacterium]
MNSFRFIKGISPIMRLFLVFIFLGVQVAMPLNNNLGDAQAAPALEPELAPVMESGEPRPLAAVANLLLTKTIDGNITSAKVGDTIFYRIRFQCSSLTTDCGELEITDVLSTDFTYLPAESSIPNGYTLSESGGTVTITKTDNLFLDGSQADAVIAVRVNYDMRPLPDTIDNQVVGKIKPLSESDWLDPVTSDAPTITIETVSPDWSLEKTLYSPSINPTVDTNVTYRLRLCPNTTSGNVALTNITITDTLPLGVEFISATNSGVYTDNADPTPDTVVWSITGPVTPPDCVTRYVTIRFNSTDFDNTDTGLTNSVDATADYVDDSGGPCPDCYGSGTEGVTHDMQDVVEGVNYSKDDTGDPVGIHGTGRFLLALDTNATNYPANEVVLVDYLPDELKVMQITSGAWAQELDGTPLFDIVRAEVYISTYDSPDIDISSDWTKLGSVGDYEEYNENTLYDPLPNNITAVRWNFEHDSDRDGNWEPGLPFDWSFSSAPEIRITPRLSTTDTTDDTPTAVSLNYVDPATLPQTYENCLVARRRDSGGNLVGGNNPADCDLEPMTVDQDFVSLRTSKEETPGESYDKWGDPNIDNFTADSTILPNDTLRYTISVEVTERSSVALDGLAIRDIMPANLVFVRQGDILFDGNPLPASGTGYTVDAAPSFTQAGQTLTWRWNNNAEASPKLHIEPLDYGNHTVTVEFYARVLPGTLPGTYTNELFSATDTANIRCENGSRGPDSGDVDGDSNLAEDSCENPDTYRVERSAALRGEKWIRSIDDTVGWQNAIVVDHETFTAWQLDPNVPPADNRCPDGSDVGLSSVSSTNHFTRYPCISQAYPEGALGPDEYVSPTTHPDLDDFEYNIRIFNEGNVPMLEYVLYDILPYWGDTGSGGSLTNDARKSEFRPALIGPVQFIQGPGTLSTGDFEIEYSFSTNPCRAEVFDEYVDLTTPNGCTNDWTTTVADWSTVRAYRIRLISDEIAYAVADGDELRFGMLMSIPQDAPPSGFDQDDAQTKEIAWNSFAHVGSYDHTPANPNDHYADLLASEPRKVGITIPERFSIGNRVWRDSDNSGTINAPDDADPGIGGVLVHLYEDANTDGAPDDINNPIATTITDVAGPGVEAGYYLFSNLPAGNYIVGIPASNFDNSGDPLYGLHSSTGTPAISKYTTTPLDANVDKEDHGIDTNAAPTPSLEVFSPTIELSSENEPRVEDDLSDDDKDGSDGARRGLNGETDDNSDLTVDFGFFGGTDIPFSIGNHLWFDDGLDSGGNLTGVLNDGIRQIDELPVIGARVELYRDGDGDGKPQDDELIRFDVTDSGGFYLFDNLDPGNYFVKVAAGNFDDPDFDPDDSLDGNSSGPLSAAPGVLQGWYSSQPTGTENAGVAGNTNSPNMDSDDNGVNTDFPHDDGVISSVIELAVTPSEPTGEAHLSGDTTDTGLAHNPTAWDGPNSRGRFGEADNTSNLTIDFGFIPPMSLGNRVWIDDGVGSTAGYNNGIQDGTEAGVANVRVQLWRETNGSSGLKRTGATSGRDTFIEEVGTDVNGYYLFDRLQPGDYYVWVSSWNFKIKATPRPLEGYLSSFDSNQTTTPADDFEDMDDNGIDDTNPLSNGITSPEIEMAYTTEPQNSTTIPTPEVNPRTEVDLSSDTTAYGPNNVGLYEQTDPNSNLTVDFGFILPPQSLGNFLWYDDDNDGEKDAGEGNLPANVRVSLYLDDNTDGAPDDLGVIGDRTDDWILYDLTDANGYYLFDDLAQRNYIVGVDSGNFSASFDPDGGGTLPAAPGVLLGYTSSTTTYDNASNNTDSLDNGIDRLSPENAALSPHGVISTTINMTTMTGYPTGETGSGETDPGAPGNASNNPTGWDGPDSRGRFGETDALSDLTIDFGFFKPMSIGNRVFLDNGASGGNSNNGIMDGGEVPINNVRLELWRDTNTTSGLQMTGATPDTFITFDITNTGGYYLFDRLVAGDNYYIHIPAGNFTSSYDPTGGSGTAEGALHDLNSSNPTGSENVGVSGNTYTPNTDRDDNGVDNGTPYTNGISSGVIILLLDNEPISESELSAETDPGSPTNDDFGPTGWDGPVPGSRGRWSETDANSNLTIDFGFFPVFSIGNRVWFDTNNDSTMGTSEVGVNGVRIHLYNGDGSSEIQVGPDGILGTTDDNTDGVLTNADGYYLFNNLPAGDYTVVLSSDNFGSSAVLEEYWSSGTSRNSSGALTESIAPDPDTNIDLDDNGMLQSSGTFSGGVIAQPLTLGPTYNEPQNETDVDTGGQGQPDDQANMTVDFGFYTMNLGNLVWLDSDYDGKVTSGETGIDGVTVELYAVDSSGNPVGSALASAITGSGSWGTGEYSFTGLPAGDYVVRIPASEFEGTETLVGYVTSEGASSYYEPAPDADIDTNDNDDNGSETGGATGSGGYIQSKVVTLTPGNEASLDHSTGTTNEPRVDFGVFKLATTAKSLIATSEDDSPGTQVFIGETLTYQIQLTIPPGTMYSLKALDTMENGLAFDDCIGVSVSSSTNVTTTQTGGLDAACPAASGDPNVTNTGHNVIFEFGDVTNSGSTDENITVQYHVIVLDIASNVNGVDDLNNQVLWTWTGEERNGQADPVEIIEPDMDITKTTTTTTANLGSIIPFSIEIYQTDISAADAYDVIVTDVLPDALEYVAGSISVGAPIPYDSFDYDSATRTITLTWDYFPLNDGANRASTTVTFETEFIGPAPVTNEANVEWTSLPIDPQPDGSPVEQSEYNEDSTERWYDPADQANIDDYGRTSSVEINVPALPSTGFAPNRITALPKQPATKKYQNVGATWIDIPKLNAQLPIVGVPLKDDGWDLTWLDAKAGYLESTAYLGLPGNTAITAHVYLADGSPGPFVDLHTLKWGDEVILHANGQRYTYQVRTQRKVWPNDLSILNHEEYDWITLITCQGYDEKLDSYDYRIAVRAILMDVQPE